MGCTHPPVTDRNRPIVDPGDSQLLEPFDPTDYIDQCVQSANLMKRYLGWRKAVHLPFRFSQELERAHGALTHPLGQLGSIDDRNQVADVTVWPLVLPMGVALGSVVRMGLMVMVMLRSIDDGGGFFRGAVGKHDTDLGRAYAAAIDRSNLHGEFGNTETRREGAKPLGARSSRHQRPQ